MSHKSVAVVGTEWLVDALGCQPAALRDAPLLQRLCHRMLRELELHVVGAGLWHAFPGAGGVTGLYLLTESHLACHTYPESGTATFNLYCCRSRPCWAWEQVLREELGASQVRMRSVSRGVEAAVAPVREESPGE